VDLLAELFLRGAMTKDGRINCDIKSGRIINIDGCCGFVLVPKAESATGKDIIITDVDIENLKRSKGAIYSAISFLFRKLGLSFKDLDKLYLAGGFGNRLDMTNAVTIGLLPDLEKDVFEFVGNTSVVGAHQILLSYEAMKKAETIAKKITYIELSAEKDYMDEYMSSLFFPHTDLSRFGSVGARIRGRK
jgi:uncharacterized 2Fe-2S/4Fe-4S cluster protein (DUF4445 family)